MARATTRALYITQLIISTQSAFKQVAFFLHNNDQPYILPQCTYQLFKMFLSTGVRSTNSLI